MDARHLFIAALAVSTWTAAQATDIGLVPLPAPVTDRSLALGGRAVNLPEGNWTLVSRTEGAIKLDSGVRHLAPHLTVYAADVEKGRLRTGVILRMAVNSVRVRGWKDDPCKVTGELHKEELSPEHRLDECIVVWKRNSHLRSSAPEGVYVQAQQWADDHKIDRKGGFYEIFYARFASNDFGTVRVYVPVSTFASDADAIAWGKQLPGALQRVFERRDNTGALPPLPATAKP
jgi:hypothetical protein